MQQTTLANANITQPLHLALGMFDGVHRGHKQVLSAAQAAAASSEGRGAIWGALTFPAHPSHFLRPGSATLLIQTVNAKLRTLEKLGAGVCILEPFTHEFANIPAENFVQHLKMHLPTLCSLSVGENFGFGAKRAGNAQLLKTSAAKLNIHVNIVPRVSEAGEAVSSTRIRTALTRGDVAGVAKLLGGPYAVTAPVIPGQAKGRQLGFPTLNMQLNTEVQPRWGVYISRMNGHPSISNFGTRPTVSAQAQPVLETHVLDAAATQLPAHGQTATVQLLQFLRGEQKFESLDALIAQIQADASAARAHFA